MDTVELDTRFNVHDMNVEQLRKAAAVRHAARLFAEVLEANCPDGREKMLAFTQLEMSMMWGVCAIARRTPAAELDDALAKIRNPGGQGGTFTHGWKGDRG